MTYDSEVLADTPAGYWKLDETSGTTATDSSGNGLNGTYTGGVTLANRSIFNGTLVFPDFNGSSGWVNLGTPSGLNFKDVWSLEAWAVSDIVGTGEQYIVSEGWGGSGSLPIYYSLCKNLAGSGSGIMKGGMYDGAWRTVNDSLVVPAGTFCHWVVTYDGTNLRLYRDGVLVGGPTASAVASGTDFNTVAIGARKDGSAINFWDGGICRVAIYHSALSATRVGVHYSAGLGPSTAKVYHEYAEAILRLSATERVYHEYSEAIVRTAPQERLFHQYAEVLCQTAPPIRNYHQYAEVIVGPGAAYVPMGLQ